jgi:hypothetical protein
MSPAALAIYIYMLVKGEVLAAEKIVELGEIKYGKHATRTALRELKTLNLIWSKRQPQANGRWATIQGFSLPDRWLLDGPLHQDPSNGLYILLVSLYSFYSSKANISNIANTTISSSIANTLNSYAYPKINFGEKDKDKNIINIGGSTVSFEFSADDLEYEEEKAQEKVKGKVQKNQDYKDDKAILDKKRKKARSERPISDWDTLDVAREFANRLHNRFDLPPWEMSSTRFVYALSTAQKKHTSTPELELKMMDLHLAEPAIRGMKDPTAIAMLFVKNYGSLLERARYQHVSQESWDEYYSGLEGRNNDLLD